MTIVWLQPGWAQHSLPPSCLVVWQRNLQKYVLLGGGRTLAWPGHHWLHYFISLPVRWCILSRQIVRYHLAAVQRPHQTGPEINGGGAPWLWPACLSRLYFVKIFHQIRNISHSNQREEGEVGGCHYNLMLILCYCRVPSHLCNITLHIKVASSLCPIEK